MTAMQGPRQSTPDSAARQPQADDHQPAANPLRRFSPEAVDGFHVRYRVALDEQDPAEALRRFSWRRRQEAEIDEMAKIQEDYRILACREQGMEPAAIGEILGVSGSAVETRLARARKRVEARRHSANPYVRGA